MTGCGTLPSLFYCVMSIVGEHDNWIRVATLCEGPDSSSPNGARDVRWSGRLSRLHSALHARNCCAPQAPRPVECFSHPPDPICFRVPKVHIPQLETLTVPRLANRVRSNLSIPQALAACPNVETASKAVPTFAWQS